VIEGLNLAAIPHQEKMAKKRKWYIGRTVVDHMTIDPEIKGSNLAVIQHQKNIAEEKEKKRFMVTGGRTVADHMTTDPGIEGLNLTAIQEKTAKKRA
jgi:hypothetical protein